MSWGRWAITRSRTSSTVSPIRFGSSVVQEGPASQIIARRLNLPREGISCLVLSQHCPPLLSPLHSLAVPHSCPRQPESPLSPSARSDGGFPTNLELGAACREATSILGPDPRIRLPAHADDTII